MPPTRRALCCTIFMRTAGDKEILELLDIPASLLPRVKDCSADFGLTDPAIFGAAIPIGGIEVLSK